MKQWLKWIKQNTIWLVVVTALLVFVATLAVMATFFGIIPSEKIEAWGQTGDFIGGIFNPLFTLFGFTLILTSLHQQRKEFRLTQLSTAKESTLEAIHRHEVDLSKILNTTITFTLKDGHSGKEIKSYNAHDILFDMMTIKFYKQCMPTKERISSEDVDSNGNDILSYSIFALAAGELNQIRLYIWTLYDIEKQIGFTPLTKYYQRKYKQAYLRCKETGYLTADWVHLDAHFDSGSVNENVSRKTEY